MNGQGHAREPDPNGKQAVELTRSYRQLSRRAARTYGAAADHYGLASLSFWTG